MKRSSFAGALLLVAALPSAPALAVEGSSVHLGFLPASFTIHPAADDFTARGDRLADDTSWTPSFLFGYEYDRTLGFGLDAFLGGLFQEDLAGTLYGANLSFILPHPPNAVFRGRLIGGVTMASLAEDADVAVEFEDAVGWQVGMGLELGRGRFSPLVLELLYRSLEMDVDEEHSVAVSDPTLDLSGFSLSIGFKFNFY